MQTFNEKIDAAAELLHRIRNIPSPQQGTLDTRATLSAALELLAQVKIEADHIARLERRARFASKRRP